MAGELTYGGVPLCVATPDIAAWIELSISVRDALQWRLADWPVAVPTRRFWQFPTSLRSVKVGQLFWPTGAARWAQGHFLIWDRYLPRLRQQVYRGANQYEALPLVMDDAAGGRVAADLYLLPPRPLAQLGRDEELYLITLVDERFFWWEKAADIPVDAGTTTWSELLGLIAAALGISLDVDPISANYLYPAAGYAAHYEYLPPLLDACCWSVGQRFVRRQDGTCLSQNPASAKADHDAQLARGTRQAGGLFALDRRQTPHDLPAIAPQSVSVIFPETTGDVPTGAAYAETVLLTSLALPEYAGVTGHAGSKLLHTLACRDSAGANAAEVLALARQTARDWYLWQLGRRDTKLAGSVPYELEGLTDHVEWVWNSQECSTRIQRGPWEDVGPLGHHSATAGSAVECCGGVSVVNIGGDDVTVIVNPLKLTPTVTIVVPTAFTDDALVITQAGTTTTAIAQQVTSTLVSITLNTPGTSTAAVVNSATATTTTGTLTGPGSNPPSLVTALTNTTLTTTGTGPGTTPPTWVISYSTTTVTGTWTGGGGSNPPTLVTALTATTLTTTQTGSNASNPPTLVTSITTTTVTQTSTGQGATPSIVAITTGATTATLAITTGASQSGDIVAITVSGALTTGVTSSGVPFVYSISPGTPATSQLLFAFDDSTGAPALLLTGKDDGGTQATWSIPISDPGADSLLFWDDSAGKVQYATLGTGLTMTGTTLSATGSGGIDGSGTATHFAVWLDADTVDELASTDDGTDMHLTTGSTMFLDCPEITVGDTGQELGVLGATPVVKQTLSGAYDSTSHADLRAYALQIAAVLEAFGFLTDSVTWM